MKTKKRSRETYAERFAKAYCKRHGRCEAEGREDIPCAPRKPGFPLLEWCHIIGRSSKRVKFFPENCLCLCGAHHAWYTNHPAAFHKLVEELHPGRMDKLYQIERDNPKWGTIDNNADYWINFYKFLGVKLGKTVREDCVEV